MKTNKWIREQPLHLMILPSLILLLLFSYTPMLGLIIAFQKFYPSLGIFRSNWVGLDNFKYMIDIPFIGQVIWNTVAIAVMKMIASVLLPLVVSITLNEVRQRFVRGAFQTLIYIPHFLSWVILSGIMIDLLSMDGIVNSFISTIFNSKPIFFMGNNDWFRTVVILSDAWKEFGFITIVYLAAIMGINPALYESAVIDGANRWKMTLHITLPGMLPIILLMVTISLGNVLNAGFDQIFNLYNPAVYETGDIIDTLIYRMGLVNNQYGISTAVGLFKSVIAFALISISYWVAYRFANYRIF